MFRLNNVSKLIACVGLPFIFLTASIAQTRTISPAKTEAGSPAQVSSTLDVQPQITPDPAFNPTVSPENDGPPVRGNPGPRNNLRAGGFLSGPRGSAGSAYFPGPVDGRYEPADNQMAVGPNHIVCIVNAIVAFYTKDGTKQFQQLLDGSNGFFAGVAQSGFVFDPKAFYDPGSQRFFLIADDGASTSLSNILVAVSATNNPNGTWFKYRFNTLFNGSWLDFPGFGFNKDAIIITGNLFSGTGSGVEALVIKKAPLLTGAAATATVFNDPTNFTLQPARTVDTTIDKIYGAASVFPSGNSIHVFAFTNLTAAPVLKEVDIAVPSYSAPSQAANSVGNALDPDDDRLWVANFRNGRLLTSQTIDVNGHCGGRWYDFNVNSWPASGTPTLKQSGTISQPNTDIFYPAINMNTFEDISVFYTRSSSSIVSDLCYSARVASDPLGQIGQPVKLFGSTNGGYGGRWGDYLANEIDPNDDWTFWGFSMAVNGGAYSTQVQSWTVTVGNGTGNPISVDSVSPFVGNLIFGDNTTISTADGIYYQVGSAGVPQFGQAAGVDAHFTIPDGTANISIDTLALADASGGTTMCWVYNWITARFDLLASTPTPTSGSTHKFFNIRPADLGKYVGAGNAVRVRLRGHLPIRPITGSLPNPFTFKIDLLQLLVR